MLIKNTRWLLVISIGVMTLACTDGSNPSTEEEHDDEKGERLILSESEREESGIVIETVTRQTMSDRLEAPGEVIMNAYTSSKVTPRIPAQVAERHVRLGEHVATGQALVTLTSVEMAQAQGDLLIADREWQRVTQLGRDVVSDRRYTEAQVARQQAMGKVIAYGMTERQVEQLLKSGDASKATGGFDLLSPQDGTVIRDDFVAGELIEPGRVLFEISEESRLWVEARITPRAGVELTEGTLARVAVTGDGWIDGKVVQIRHQVDETTRTQAVRIEVDNRDHRLHPGQFVEVELMLGDRHDVLGVPTSAILLVQGQPSVFRLKGDEFYAQPISKGATLGGWTEITAGLTDDEEVVVKGVYVLKAIMLKAETGAGHAH